MLYEADGLFGCWYLSPFDRPPDSVIHLMMTLVPGTTLMAAQTMKSRGIHCSATSVAVWFAGFAPQSIIIIIIIICYMYLVLCSCEEHQEKLSVYCWSCRACICHQCALWGGMVRSWLLAFITTGHISCS